MADNNAKSGGIAREFGGLPLKALIGAPLKAAADANGMLARSQTQFILSTCFDADESGKLVPKMIEFDIHRTVINHDGTVADETAKMSFSIPMLTLVPINTLAVDELDVAFEMEVKSSREYNHESVEDEKNASKGHLTSPYNADKFSCEMHGTLTNSKDQSGKNSGNARYEIKMHAGKSPLPLGLTTIIDVFAKNIAPIQLKDPGNSNTKE